jgi:putative FmdB family regulatory protein
VPTYDYQCQACSVVHEHIQSIHKRLPDTLSCPRCGKDSELVILVAPGLATSGMQHMTQDVAIGKDADKRWSDIHAKKAVRDKIRRESGKMGIERKNGVYKAHDRNLDFVKTPEPKEG